MGKFIDLKGLFFGDWEVLEYEGKSKWKCKCKCGVIRGVATASLKRGASKNCGCNKIKHGQEGTKLYKVWGHMKERCFNKNNKSYDNYGGRGIVVVDEWLDFNNFYNWAQNNDYKEGLSIDRIDVNGNYAPDNCRFITMKEQQMNKRNNLNITIEGVTKVLSEWARIANLEKQTIRHRVKRGEKGIKILRAGRKGGGIDANDIKRIFN